MWIGLESRRAWLCVTTLPSMDPVPTQYVDRDGAAMAYQVVGDGPVDDVAYSGKSTCTSTYCRRAPTCIIFSNKGAVTHGPSTSSNIFGLSDPVSRTFLRWSSKPVMSSPSWMRSGCDVPRWLGVLRPVGHFHLSPSRSPEQLRRCVLIESACFEYPGDRVSHSLDRV